MPGTRTAATVNGTPLRKQISIRVIDATGDKASDVILAPATVTDAEIEAYVAAYVAASNASVYRVEVSFVYSGQEDAGNALAASREGVQEVINFLAKSDTDDAASQRAVLRAPLTAMFVTESDQIVITNATYEAWYVAATALFNGGAGGSGDYSSRSSKFSERKGTNNTRQTH